jgi:hypothetical protein
MGHPEMERLGMKARFRSEAVGVLAILAMVPAWTADEPRLLLLVTGAPGEASHGKAFADQARAWSALAGAAGDFEIREPRGREELQEACRSGRFRAAPEVWIVLVGHGTDDGRTAKFNLEGPDVAAGELSEWIQERTGPLVVVHAGECSGGFVPALSGPGRVVVTATQSGHEVVLPRFGGELAAALGDAAADLDQDGQVSVLEAFLAASARTAAFYEREGRLASEHALLDDNGDGKGTRADWFEGVRVVRRAADGEEADGKRARGLHLVPGAEDRKLTAEQRALRERLEAEVEALRGKRGEMGDAAWYDALEALFVRLGELRGGQPDS